MLPESSNRPLRICNLLSEITEEESGHADIRRPGRDKRASVVSTVTLASAEYEREFLQRNRDISVTFGYGETGSTQDLRWAEDLFNIKVLNISILKSLPSFMFNHHRNVQYNFMRKLRNNLTNAFDMYR